MDDRRDQLDLGPEGVIQDTCDDVEVGPGLELGLNESSEDLEESRVSDQVKIEVGAVFELMDPIRCEDPG